MGWVDFWPKGTSDNNILNYSANRTTRLLRQLSRTALVQATSDDYHLNHTHQLVQLLSALYIDSNQASSFAFLDAPVKPSFPNKAWWRPYDFVGGGKRILADVYRSFWRIGAFLKTKCVVARERQCRDNGRFRRWLCMRRPTPHCLFRGKVSHTAPTRSSICTRPLHTDPVLHLHSAWPYIWDQDGETIDCRFVESKCQKLNCWTQKVNFFIGWYWLGQFFLLISKIWEENMTNQVSNSSFMLMSLVKTQPLQRRGRGGEAN